MAVSDDLSRLSVRAKEAEDRVAAAKTKAQDKLEQDVESARQRTQGAAEKLRSRAIDFAYSAIEEAEYAVLDAVLSREEADAAAGTVRP